MLKNNIVKFINDEKFYKNICEKYIQTMSKEMLISKNNKILHIFIEDKYIDLKEDGKINKLNYEKYLDVNFEIYEYDSYEELYWSVVKEEIEHDLNDLELFDENGKWVFYISFEELKRIGYGFAVKNQFPLLEEYAVPDNKIFEFFDLFLLEELDYFEQSLNQYFNEDSIEYDDYDELYSKEGAMFNIDIIRLACGLITYDDFISNYVDELPEFYNFVLLKVMEYFKENRIESLMEYGSDGDEGLYHLSSMYQEIMDKLEIKYSDVYTEDVSAGKYLTTVVFDDNSSIKVDTSAWNGIIIVTINVESIYKEYQKIREKIEEKKSKNESEIEYNVN